MAPRLAQDGRVHVDEYFALPKSNQRYWDSVDVNNDECASAPLRSASEVRARWGPVARMMESRAAGRRRAFACALALARATAGAGMRGSKHISSMAQTRS